MNDPEFKELIDLYLDKEIDGASIQRLREAIAADEGRRREFEAACQLHHAMRLALGKEVAANEARNPLPLRRWLVTAGMAASFVLGGFLLAPAFNEAGGVDPLDPGIPDASARTGAAQQMDNLPLPSKRQLARISTGERGHKSSSLAALFRLAGLSPELEPPDAQLQEVRIGTRRIHLAWDGSAGGWQVHSQASVYFTTPSSSPGESALVSTFADEARLKHAGTNVLAGGPFRLEAIPMEWLAD